MDAKSDTLNRLQLSGTGEEIVLLCNICDAKLTKNQVAQHCEQEVERLQQMDFKGNSGNGTNENHEDHSKPWTVFQKVQRNRQSRLKQRTRKRSAPPIEHPCPVCNVNYPQDEIQRHAERCLRQSNGGTNGRDENSSNEEDDGEEYEEYEWAGQKRIRVSSLLQGGYAAIGIGQTTSQNGAQQDDEDEDLNVDEDDTHIYGPQQYGEGDVIPPTTQQNGPDEVTSYMRSLITCNTNTTTTTTTTVVQSQESTENHSQSNISNDSIPKDEPVDVPAQESTATLITTTSNPMLHLQNSEQVIEALKNKVRQLENQAQSKFKCLICLDDYRNPAISVSCWHVHCEECWLRSLGARKLCPQCNLITTPKDLRRIYM